MARGNGERPEGAGLGTFGGVFTPSILTILGIIFFLRLGWVVGGAGLARALCIIAVAHAVSVLTSVSLAAIATNRRVRGGGDYFLISRSLGLDYGGAVGLVLFAAQAIAVAFYCFGFGEAVAALLPGLPGVTPRTLAAGAAVVLFGVSLIGADFATRFQYGIMAVIGLAIAGFAVGALPSASLGTLSANWSAPADGLPFWVAFAIFFPAVTGFTQGVSLSGDLRDPARSLPLGTFAAVGVSLVAYSLAALAFAAAAPAAHLSADYMAMRRVAIHPNLVDAGVVAATLSSALASFLGAPRILQAMARDRLVPVLEPFAVGSGPAENPRRGVVLTAAIALAGIALGDLNAIAPVISMFLLISYGLLNYATFVEARGNSPSFRPRFRFFHARASLLGTLLCGGVMLAIAPLAGAFALALVAALVQFLRNRSVPGAWADSRRAYGFRLVKETLHQIARQPETEWTRQPHVLAFTEQPENRDLFARFAGWLSGTSGLTVVVEVIEGEPELPGTVAQCRETREAMEREFGEQKLEVFARAIAMPKRRIAIDAFLQSWGVGPIQANLVITDWNRAFPVDEAEEPGGKPDEEALHYGRQLLAVVRHGCDLVMLDLEPREWRRIEARDPDARRIDVWWAEDVSSRLSLLLAYLMTRDPFWADAEIRLLATSDRSGRQPLERRLKGLLREARIPASIEILEGGGRELAEASESSSIVLLPVRVEGMRRIATKLELPLAEIVAELPVVCLVAAAHDVRLRDEDEPPPADGNGEPRKSARPASRKLPG